MRDLATAMLGQSEALDSYGGEETKMISQVERTSWSHRDAVPRQCQHNHPWRRAPQHQLKAGTAQHQSHARLVRPNSAAPWRQ